MSHYQILTNKTPVKSASALQWAEIYFTMLSTHREVFAGGEIFTQQIFKHTFPHLTSTIITIRLE